MNGWRHAQQAECTRNREREPERPKTRLNVTVAMIINAPTERKRVEEAREKSAARLALIVLPRLRILRDAKKKSLAKV